ncbi:hypothetical protein [Lentzea sp. NPDC059081]|uniref:hypothetical protein n=1 Tax=Lentzea sp. NPDC059081 TaxID=3346719 RepID=UPI0036911180
MTNIDKEFTDEEKAAYEPGPCKKGHERTKDDVEWLELPPGSNFGQISRRWLIRHENCQVCGRPPAEPGDEWRDELD